MDSMFPKSDGCQIGLLTAAHIKRFGRVGTQKWPLHRMLYRFEEGILLTALERILLKKDAMLADFSLVVTPWGGGEEGSSAAQAGVKAKGEQPCVSGRSSESGYRRPGSRRRGVSHGCSRSARLQMKIEVEGMS